MSLPIAIFLVGGGVALVVYFAEKLVAGCAGTAAGFGVSAFAVSVLFLGFDPENLAVGAVGAHQGIFGIALGTIIGSAMVAIALAFGVTALLAPMTFARADPVVLALPVVAVGLFGALCLDGLLSRLDGILLVAGYGAAIATVWILGRRGTTLEPPEAEEIEEGKELGRWKALGFLLLSLAGVFAGSEMIVEGSKTILSRFGISDTVWGMTLLALLVSVEEIARELPAALKGRPEITYGNVVGSVFAFFLLNAGVIALIRPVPVGADVLAFHLPAAVLTTLAVTGFAAAGRVPRWAGVLLVILYAGFFAGSYVV